MSTPEQKLKTGFILDDRGRILSTREPGAERGPLFTLVRSATHCAWAVRQGLADDLAMELERLASEEPPVGDLERLPVHARLYRALLRENLGQGADAAWPCESGGPAFTFPDVLPDAGEVVAVDDEAVLTHFKGWVPGEIAAGRAPMLGVVEGGKPVSVCFCARRSDDAAEAGLETAPAFRGRGLAVRSTAAWARAVRVTGRVPLYSTEWTNDASRRVARKLGLLLYAGTWSLSD